MLDTLIAELERLSSATAPSEPSRRRRAPEPQPVASRFGTELDQLRRAEPDDIRQVEEIVGIAGSLDGGATLELLPPLVACLCAGGLDGMSLDGREHLLRSLKRLVALSVSAGRQLLLRLEQLRSSLPETELEELIDIGLEKAGESGLVAEAFFALDSSSAQRTLERLAQRSSFASHHRLLELYAEAMIGRPVPLRRTDDAGREPAGWSFGFRGGPQPEQRPPLPSSDGITIFLPPFIERYGAARLNFVAYKVATLHQLGYYLCGTFDFDLDRWLERESELAASLQPAPKARPRAEEPRSSLRRFFSLFENAELARVLFALLEATRVDATLCRRFRGYRRDVAQLCAVELEGRDSLSAALAQDRRGEVLAQLSIRAVGEPGLLPEHARAAPEACAALRAVADRAATVADSARAAVSLYDWLGLAVPAFTTLYRGSVELDAIAESMSADDLRAELEALLEGAERLDRDADDVLESVGVLEPDQLGVLSLQDGNLFGISGLLQEGLDASEELLAAEAPEVPVDDHDLDRRAARLRDRIALRLRSLREDGVFVYDEWDFEIDDYRRQWCRLKETRLSSVGTEFVDNTRHEHAELSVRVRRQFERLKPELYRRVYRLVDGEDLDLDSAVEAIADRRAKASPSDKLYMRRSKQERDVAAIFLLDMSASTDQEVVDEGAADSDAETEPIKEYDFVDTLAEDPLWGAWDPSRSPPQLERRRVIDVEKEALVLMADALEELGDAYAVYGFSGYGREAVDFFVAKEFDDAWDVDTQGRLAAMEPRQSTRMGPAIRHSLRKLRRQEARVRALIVLSDGFPQDHDYGRERGSHTYGMHDTMMALREAELNGVHTFCITVDPAGHDYLRTMCPARQYLVIDDIASLPDELPKVYRGVTS